MDRRGFHWRWIMCLSYIPSCTGGFGHSGELVSCRSCSGILSSILSVISHLLIRRHPSDVTPGWVIGSILPRTIAGNSFPRSAYLFSVSYQDSDLTTHSLVNQEKIHCHRSMCFIILNYIRNSLLKWIPCYPHFLQLVHSKSTPLCWPNWLAFKPEDEI